MISYLKDEFAKLLTGYLGDIGMDIRSMVEVPPENISGDLAFPCFTLARDLKKAPPVIAQEIVDKLSAQLSDDSIFSHFEVVAAYVNAHIKSSVLAKDLVTDVIAKGDNFGKGEVKNETILIESPGPNTNKPLHLGHVRNLLLGNVLENSLKFAGYNAKRVDIVNDRGVHICKSMLAYQRFGDNAEPNKKSDHYVGDRYVRYANEVKEHPEMEDEIQDMLVAWEAGESDVRALWAKMNTWALDGHKVTYARYGTTIEKAYLESDHYQKGKDLVEGGLTAGIFEKDEKGNIVCDLEDLKLDKKVVLRSDGTSIYITQDMALAKIRYEDYHMDRMVHVVGNEQKDHFRALFEILKRLGMPFADKTYHLAYGMISLPDGKMKSREGNVVDADNLADEMHAHAKELLQERYPDMETAELEHRSEAIAMAAIKFFILKYEVAKNFIFDPKESLSFEGETGPYLQYSYARISSILRKAGSEGDLSHASKLIEAEEKSLMMTLAEFAEIVQKAADEYKPNMIARWTLDLAKRFNNYYQKHKIMGDDIELQNARLALAKAVAIGLKNGLALLGIEVLEEM